jgi:hypothetical protein
LQERRIAPRRWFVAAAITVVCGLLGAAPALAASNQPVPDPAPGTTPSPDPAPGTGSEQPAAPPARNTPQHTTPTQTTPQRSTPTQTTPQRSTPAQTTPQGTTPAPQTVTSVQTAPTTATRAQPRVTRRAPAARRSSDSRSDREPRAAKPAPRAVHVTVLQRPDAATMGPAEAPRGAAVSIDASSERVVLPAALSLCLLVLAGGLLLWRTTQMQRRTGWR